MEWTVRSVIAVYLLGANLVGFILMGADKKKARKKTCQDIARSSFGQGWGYRGIRTMMFPIWTNQDALMALQKKIGIILFGESFCQRKILGNIFLDCFAS